MTPETRKQLAYMGKLFKIPPRAVLAFIVERAYMDVKNHENEQQGQAADQVVREPASNIILVPG
jgi:hypothetical protein